jgi:MoxR-like ATPase
VVGYPTAQEEAQIVARMGVRPPHAEQVLSPDDLLRLQDAADAVQVAPAVADYAVRLVLATREPESHHLPELSELVAWGASPRATLGLVAGGRALALMRGRNYVLPQDVFDVAPDVLRHRLVPSYEALAQGVSVEQLLARLLSTVHAPVVAPSQDPTAASGW